MSEEEQTSQVVGAGKPESKFNQVFQGLAVLDTVVLRISHLLTVSPFLTLNDTEQAVIHGALVVAFFLLVRHLKFKGGKLIDIGLIVITIMAAYQVIAMRNSDSVSAVPYSQFRQTISIIFVIVMLFVGYRALGKILPTLCVLFPAYALLGRYLPGAWATTRITVAHMSTCLIVSSEGLFGNALSAAANFIFLLIIFGSVLNFIRTGKFFVKIALAAFGKVCGGPAQATVCSSMLMGTVNGSGAANVVTTGTFTIPLMKQTGFDKDTAGAIEAVASNGGQVMPPIMGTVAFLMANAASLPYTVIYLAALLPAVLYYITLSTSITTYSHRNKIPMRESDSSAETTRQIFKSGWFYFLPIGVSVELMVKGFSTQRTALITIILYLVIGLLTDRKKFTARNLIDLYVQSAKSIMTMSTACMITGVIVGSINITGLGLEVSGLTTVAAGGRIFIMGILTAIVCIALGMGLPVSTCYIALAVLVAPAMIDLDMATISAHMFVLYYGVVVAIVPPMALAVFAVVGISGGDMRKTEFRAVKITISGFVILFIFLCNTDLLIFNSVAGAFGSTPMVALSFVTAALRHMIMALALFGQFLRDSSWIGRVILLVCAMFLTLNGPLILNDIGFVIAMVVLFSAKATTGKKEVVV